MIDNPFAVLERRLNRLEFLLLEIKESRTTTATTPPTEKPLSVTEAAEFLNLEPATIYGLVHKKEIPYQKPAGSKRLYFFESQLIDWLKSGRKKTTAELATDAGLFLKKGPKAKGAKK